MSLKAWELPWQPTLLFSGRSFTRCGDAATVSPSRAVLLFYSYPLLEGSDELGGAGHCWKQQQLLVFLQSTQHSQGLFCYCL